MGNHALYRPVSARLLFERFEHMHYSEAQQLGYESILAERTWSENSTDVKNLNLSAMVYEAIVVLYDLLSSLNSKHRMQKSTTVDLVYLFATFRSDSKRCALGSAVYIRTVQAILDFSE